MTLTGAGPTKSLRDLLTELPAYWLDGSDAVTIAGITHDSRLVTCGSLFVCVRGEHADGHRFVDAAVAAGAAAIVSATDADIGAPGAPIVRTPDTRVALALIAGAFHGWPARRLTVTGVTGTNGKTTTTRMLAHILRRAGFKTATIGTLGAELDGVSLPSDHTTPQADMLQALLAELVHRGAQQVVMEVSSHALDQRRTDGIPFACGIFTNLTHDHLDYHTSMEAYLAAKARLFTEYPTFYPPAGRIFAGVVNTADWPGMDLVARSRGDVLSFSTGPNPANLIAREPHFGAERTRFTAVYQTGGKPAEVLVDLPVGGAFQVGNALAAIGAAIKLGIELEAAAEALATLPPPPGRFESVATYNLGFGVIVDYAHTPDGLANLIAGARALNPGRIVLVFGCGGDRDRPKRAIMGRIAAEGADVVVVTSDNPRTEDPDAIIREIVPGLGESAKTPDAIHIEPDRRAAIDWAIGAAVPGDIVLIAGKGHEDYQIVGLAKLPFDDRTVACEAIAARSGAG